MTLQWRQVVAGTITAGAVIVFVSTFAHAALYAPEAQVAAPALEASAPASRAPAGALPARLRIPALAVDAAVQHVGLGKTGNMAVPSNFTDVAWYRWGPLPGGAGSAVIDGHVDNGFALPGVFKNLSTIAVGDDIYIDAATTTAHFVVAKVVAYPKEQVPTADIFRTSGPPQLVLITCEGDWLPGEKTYDHRLVVYANLAG